MRGLASTGIALVPSDVHVLLEHSNRGKQSLGLNLASPEGLAILYRLAETADVFLTNKLPSVRDKLKIGVEDIRAQNPNIIYVRGTGQGERGPDADKGSYDSLAFWARAGVAAGAKRPEYDLVPVPPAPGFGDSIGAMTIAGGIMGALFHRERTGEATVVDVSLFGVGLWAMGQAMALSLLLGRAAGRRPRPPGSRATRCRATTSTKDDRVLAFTCLQAGRYWPPAVRGHRSPGAGRRRALRRPRVPLGQQRPGGGRSSTEVFASATLEEWRAKLADFSGQWAVVQDTLEAVADPQAVANGYVQECRTAGGTPFQLVTVPVQFDEEPAAPQRAPEFNEHGDAVLAELGLSDEEPSSTSRCAASSPEGPPPVWGRTFVQ